MSRAWRKRQQKARALEKYKAENAEAIAYRAVRPGILVDEGDGPRGYLVYGPLTREQAERAEMLIVALRRYA